jgi:LacI family transcriptional regulator
MTKRVTIVDIAKAAGVSRQTVTRALNGLGDVSPETRERVQRISEELGYRPNRYARSLVGRTFPHTLGLLVASFRNPYYTDIAGDLLHAAAGREWQVVMTSAEPGAEAAALMLLSRQVDVIVGHFELDDDTLLSSCDGLPIISLERSTATQGIHSIDVDLRAGVDDAVSGLRARGARRIGMIDSGYSKERGSYQPSPRRGYFEHIVGDNLSGVVVGHESISGGGEALADLLRRQPDTDAVLMFNDLMALGAVQAAPALGRKVPDDLMILGIDGLHLGDAVTPPLSTISIDRNQLAQKVMDVVDQVAVNRPRNLPSVRVTSRPRVLWRGTTR